MSSILRGERSAPGSLAMVRLGFLGEIAGLPASVVGLVAR
jgi:hypothetical protein